MKKRLIIVAIVAFTLGATVDRFAKVTAYDSAIAKMGHKIDAQAEELRRLKDERGE